MMKLTGTEIETAKNSGFTLKPADVTKQHGGYFMGYPLFTKINP